MTSPTKLGKTGSFRLAIQAGSIVTLLARPRRGRTRARAADTREIPALMAGASVDALPGPIGFCYSLDSVYPNDGDREVRLTLETHSH